MAGAHPARSRRPGDLFSESRRDERVSGADERYSRASKGSFTHSITAFSSCGSERRRTENPSAHIPERAKMSPDSSCTCRFKAALGIVEWRGITAER